MKVSAILLFSMSFTGLAVGAAPSRVAMHDMNKSITECSTVNLKVQLPSPVPRHQGESNFCYAVVTADLLSAELNANVSAEDVAAQAVASDKTFLQGGTVKTAIAALSSKGACLEEVALEGATPALEILFNQLSENHLVASTAKSCDQRASIDHLQVKQFDASDFTLFTSSLKEQQELVLSQVDELLDQKKIQAVSYYSDNCVFCTPGFHVVSLVGRYMNRETGQCTYVLRNSYGNYDERSNYFGVFAKDGYIHMPREQALQEFVRIQYIK